MLVIGPVPEQRPQQSSLMVSQWRSEAPDVIYTPGVWLREDMRWHQKAVVLFLLPALPVRSSFSLRLSGLTVTSRCTAKLRCRQVKLQQLQQIGITLR